MRIPLGIPEPASKWGRWRDEQANPRARKAQRGGEIAPTTSGRLGRGWRSPAHWVRPWRKAKKKRPRDAAGFGRAKEEPAC
jgi:hypothetical protein